MTRNLITGGLGFLGTNVAKKLVKDDEEVILFDIDISRQDFIKDIKDKVNIIKGDLNNWWDVLDVVKNNNIDCIYHLGSYLANAAEANPQVAYTTNVNGVFNILEASRLFKVECVIFPSTIATYGPGVPNVVNEDIVQYPNDMYGVTKVIGERLGEYYHYKFGVNFRCVRFPAIVGPERTAGLSSYTSVMILESALGRSYQAYVDETTICPFIYKKDAVNALVSLRRSDEANLKRRVYNIEVISCTAREEADAIKKYLPKAQIEFHPDPKALKIINGWAKNFDGTRAYQDWGFHIQYDIDETIKCFINEIQSTNAVS